MTHMHAHDTTDGRIGPAAEPRKHFGDGKRDLLAPEYRHMREIVDHVGRNDQGVGDEERTPDPRDRIAERQQDDAGDMRNDDIGEGECIGDRAIAVTPEGRL